MKEYKPFKFNDIWFIETEERELIWNDTERYEPLIFNSQQEAQDYIDKHFNK